MVQCTMDTPYALRVGQNANAAKVTLYRFVEHRVEAVAESAAGNAAQISGSKS